MPYTEPVIPRSVHPSSKEALAYITGYLLAFRRVLILGDMTADKLSGIGNSLFKLDLDSNEPITLLIGSPGGDVNPTHHFEDVINMLHSPVDRIVLGECSSMAVDLVQMCRKRMSLPSARFLVHYIRSGQQWICDDLERLEGDLSYFRERMREIGERRLALYTKRTGLPVEKIQEMFRHGEVHSAKFSAKQALKLNLIDEILTDFKLFPPRPDKKSE